MSGWVATNKLERSSQKKGGKSRLADYASCALRPSGGLVGPEIEELVQVVLEIID